MESKDRLSSASGQLDEFARIQRSVERRAPARGYWVLALWSAVLMASYFGAFLFSHGGFTPAEVGARAGGYSGVWAFMAPVLIFSSLQSGARERFSIQAKPSRLQRLVYLFLTLGFVALIGLSFAGISYPGWLNAALPLAVLLALAAGPFRRLLATPRNSAEVWGNAPLPSDIRLMTACIGLFIGVLLATASTPFAAAITGMVVFLCLLLVTLARDSRFGLPRVGFEWGSIQWSAFGVCAAVAFLGFTLGNVASWFSPAWSVAAGVLVFLIMCGSAAFPRGRSRGEA